LNGAAEEVAEFYQPHLAGIDDFQFFQGAVEIKQVFAIDVDPRDFITEREVRAAGPTLSGVRATGVVCQDAAHKSRGKRVEVRAILKVGLALLDKAQIEFVDKGGGLEGLVWRFAADVSGGYFVEVRVDVGDKLVAGCTISVFPAMEQSSDVAVLYFSQKTLLLRRFSDGLTSR